MSLCFGSMNHRNFRMGLKIILCKEKNKTKKKELEHYSVCVGRKILREVLAKRASDVMTQTRLRQTNRNGGRFS